MKFALFALGVVVAPLGIVLKRVFEAALARICSAKWASIVSAGIVILLVVAACFGLMVTQRAYVDNRSYMLAGGFVGSFIASRLGCWFRDRDEAHVTRG